MKYTHIFVLVALLGLAQIMPEVRADIEISEVEEGAQTLDQDKPTKKPKKAKKSPE